MSAIAFAISLTIIGLNASSPEPPPNGRMRDVDRVEHGLEQLSERHRLEVPRGLGAFATFPAGGP